MGVEVKQAQRGASVEGPKVVAASEVGPTTYAEGGVVKQETWEAYQPEVAAEMKSAAARAEAKQQAESVPEVQVRADGGRPFADRGAAPAGAASLVSPDSLVMNAEEQDEKPSSAKKPSKRAKK